MQITLKNAQQQDAQAWDSYVAQHPQATPYHRFAWIKSVTDAYGHPNEACIAYDGAKVVGILPCSKIRIPLLGSTYCSLPFCDLGYYLADNDAVAASFNEYLKHLTHHAKVEYRDSAQPLNLDGDTEQYTHAKVRMVLTLPENAEALMKGFKSKLRSQIRKAEKNGLVFELGNSDELIEGFYRVYTENMRKLGSPPHSLAWFQALQHNYAENMIISLVKHEQQVIGAGIVLKNGVKACIPWASTLAEYNKLAPNMLLYWSLLAHVNDAGCKEFDFGRSTFNEGTYKFKQQWGAAPIMLDWRLPYEQTEHEQQINAVGKPGKIRQIVEQNWPKLPLGLTVWLGSKVRKYISL